MPKLFTLLCSSFLFLISLSGHSDPIPKSLEEWKPWVLEKHPDIKCPFFFNDQSRTCSWLGDLKIEAGSKGATFKLHIDTYTNSWIGLPGNNHYWPQNVMVGSAKGIVRDRENLPEIYLTPGSYDISGDIPWAEIPHSLTIPSQIGLVHLTLNSKAIANPVIENNNQLWLARNERQETTKLEDSLNIRVFRKIDDSIPTVVTTLIQLDISGKEREIEMGQLQLDGFTSRSLQSELPATTTKEGNLRIQAKPGTWTITFTNQSNTPITQLSYKTLGAPWPDQEIWVFNAQRQLRSVQISGASPMDPQQTQLPEEWKLLPAYLVTPSTPLIIEELQSGESDSQLANLELNREAWLSFDGSHLILRDTITGSTTESRIETTQPLKLTYAAIANTPQLITHLDANPNTGLEIRTQPNINLTGISQLPRSLSLPVSGWNSDFSKASTQLHLPPGWSLLTATGSSSEIGTWLSHWTLWDIFLVLIIILAISRLLSPIQGLLAATTLVLIYTREGAPIFIWLNLIITIALTQFVSGSFKHWVIGYTRISFLLLALILLPFCVHQARAALNPQLDAETTFELPFTSSSDKKKSAPVSAAAPIAEEFKENVEPEAEPEMAKSDAKEAPAPLVKMMRAPLETTSTTNFKRYDPNQQTQTGIATPNWEGTSAFIWWSGPIKPDESSRFLLAPPLVNRLGYFLSLLLPLLLAATLLKKFLSITGEPNPLSSLNLRKASPSTSVISVFLFLSIMITPIENAKAESIPPDILTELEERLTQPASCLPDCASLESVDLTIQQDALKLELTLHSAEFIALPLPADAQQWWPEQVLIDGNAAVLVKDANNQLLVALPKGRHKLEMKANIQGRNALALNFALNLHKVSIKADHWDISGLPSELQASHSIQLQRVEPDEKHSQSEHIRPDPIPPFVIVSRELTLDQEWTVTTQVRRVAPDVGTINMEIPLLAGEAPLSTTANANGKIAVHLESSDTQFNWRSSLAQANKLTLSAPTQVPWVEVWSINVGSIWHLESQGILPIQSNQSALTIYQPWPGQEVQLTLSRPQAAKGEYVTVDSATFDVNIGERSNTANLQLAIRTNQGGQYNFSLPEGSHLASVNIDGQNLFLKPVNNQLKLPLHPGAQVINLNWTREEGTSLLFRTPNITLEGGSSNQRIALHIPENRWIIALGGPQMGPSILLWGMLMVVILIAWALGKSNLTPLKTHEWILLSLGVCTQNFLTFVMLACWLIALHYRGKLSHISSAARFKLMQLGLFTFSLLTLGLLIATIPEGLLGTPDMRVLGNNSSDSVLHWYQDHSDSIFPQAWVVSLPLWSYKLIILLWSLWLASALLTWLRWGWQQLSAQGLWNARCIISNEKVAISSANTKPE